MKEILTIGTAEQQIVLVVWAGLAAYLINQGGRNNGRFRVVVQAGFKLITIGVITAAIILVKADPSQAVFTNAAVNFVLILSAAIGANYISHANMSLRDHPNKPSGPEQLPRFFSRFFKENNDDKKR